MAGCSKLVLFISLGFLFFAGAGQSPALAALPSDPCNATPVPAVQDGTVDVIARSNQRQRGWQRQGRDIEISLRSPKIPDTGKLRAFVCFRWQVSSENSGKIEPYRRFVQSASTGGLITVESPQQLKVIATMPMDLPDTPVSPQGPQPERVIGVYARNNAFPMADIRILLFDESGTLEFDALSAFGVLGIDEYCNTPLADTSIDNGVGVLGEHKNWQPVGGQFEFTVKTTKTIPSNAMVKVCFRWKLASGDPGPFYDSGPTHLLDKQSESIKVAATVGTIPNKPTWIWWPSRANAPGTEPRVGDYAIPLVNLVRQVDARILVVDGDGSPVADVLTTVGITNVFFAFVIVVFTVVGAFLILWQLSRYRLSSVPKGHPLLAIITRRGYASLSQFQIMLWTFVVIASAAYVMALSGDLIEISTGTLVLLGISGSSGVISKAKSESDAKAAPPRVDPAEAAAAAVAATDEAQKLRAAAAFATGQAKAEAVAAAAEAEANALAAKAKSEAADAVVAALKKREAISTAADPEKAEADVLAAEEVAQKALKASAIAASDASHVARLRHPRWSDLVMEEIQGRELDVTRVQMLYFTLVTAVFVLLKVITSYEIPVIPEGFLILMGISNSVYVGSKFAATTSSKAV
jgi:hypothetical protein